MWGGESKLRERNRERERWGGGVNLEEKLFYAPGHCLVVLQSPNSLSTRHVFQSKEWEQC